MMEFIVIVLGISFYFYVIFGGADFGAGILELFTGNKSIKPIYKAIAPVWEANHMWLILAVVIIFNAFPPIYSRMSISLHIPLFIVLIGIIMRGTAFTFRHYDAVDDGVKKYYNFFFRSSSLLTALFLGITLGAMIMGGVTDAEGISFPDKYIYPWLNPFCVSIGIFTVFLFAYIATVYIIGETETEEEALYFSKIACRFLIALFVIGGWVLILAYLKEVPFVSDFLSNPISIASWVLATAFVPLILFLMNKNNVLGMRISVAGQVAFIMLAWAAAQLPNIIFMENGNHLTLYNSVAGPSTLYYLTIALVIGVIIIFPALFYLFKVFKSD